MTSILISYMGLGQFTDQKEDCIDDSLIRIGSIIRHHGIRRQFCNKEIAM